MNRFARILFSAALVLSTPAVFAAATYSFATGGTHKSGTGSSLSGSSCSAAPTSSGSSCWGNTRGYSATESVSGATIGVTVKAYSNTGSSSSSGNANALLQTAYLSTWSTSGLGIANRDYSSSTDGISTSETIDATEGTSPEHAVDNNQRYDMLLMSFTESVALSAVKAGWIESGGDSDISVWAYVGSGVPDPAGATYATLLASGWQVIGNYADIGTSTALVNDGKLTSSYWLVGAYNPAGTAASCSKTKTANDGLDCGDDYLKLVSVSIGDKTPPPPNEVPEPASLLIVAAALMGLAWARRRTH